jgi:hypothetical protein
MHADVLELANKSYKYSRMKHFDGFMEKLKVKTAFRLLPDKKKKLLMTLSGLLKNNIVFEYIIHEVNDSIQSIDSN